MILWKVETNIVAKGFQFFFLQSLLLQTSFLHFCNEKKKISSSILNITNDTHKENILYLRSSIKLINYFWFVLVLSYWHLEAFPSNPKLSPKGPSNYRKIQSKWERKCRGDNRIWRITGNVSCKITKFCWNKKYWGTHSSAGSIVTAELSRHELLFSHYSEYTIK